MLQQMAESLAERTDAAGAVAVPARRFELDAAPVSRRLRELCEAVEEAPMSQRFSIA